MARFSFSLDEEARFFSITASLGTMRWNSPGPNAGTRFVKFPIYELGKFPHYTLIRKSILDAVEMILSNHPFRKTEVEHLPETEWFGLCCMQGDYLL